MSERKQQSTLQSIVEELDSTIANAIDKEERLRFRIISYNRCITKFVADCLF